MALILFVAGSLLAIVRIREVTSVEAMDKQSGSQRLFFRRCKCEEQRGESDCRYGVSVRWWSMDLVGGGGGGVEFVSACIMSCR